MSRTTVKSISTVNAGVTGMTNMTGITSPAATQMSWSGAKSVVSGQTGSFGG